MPGLVFCQEQSNYSELEDRTGSRPPCGVPDKDLQAILTKLVERYGTQTALAKAIGLTDSRLAKVLKGDAGTLSTLSCLRLAKVAGISPSQVLRAAGKSDVATLIEDMYGTTARPALEETNADQFLDLSEKGKSLLKSLVEELARAKRSRGRKKT